MQTNKTADLLQLKIIAFTHRNTPLKELNRFFLHEENRKERLEFLKYSSDIDEIFYLSTCNRIEFVFTSGCICDTDYLHRFFRNFRNDWAEGEIAFAVKYARVYEGENALRHLFRVAASLDSLVVGEREIITQVRKSYDVCKEEGLTGDLLRLVTRATITTAKQVYTDTRIANNPVSVVSLAERKLRKLNPPESSKVLLIGAGETNTNLAKYLIKHGFSQFVICNRTLSNAEKLAEIIANNKISATAIPLSELNNYKNGFDIMVTATHSAVPVMTPELYATLLGNDTGRKILVDLSIPAGIDHSIPEKFPVSFIDISELKGIAEKNLAERQEEFNAAEEIIEENILEFRHLYRTRTLELKMREVPEKIREIKDKAVKDVFAKEIKDLDDRSRELLGKVLDYMEKKCISVPMVMAKEIILETSE